MEKIRTRNSEGYLDLTAYEALKNIEKWSYSRMRRGDIFYVEKSFATGSEQYAGRPAIIVSNDKCNETSDVVEVVYLTTQPKNDMPTHVTIHSTGKMSTAICEQIVSANKDRFLRCIGRVSEEEMNRVNIALAISLGLSDLEPKTVEVIKEVKTDDEDVLKIMEENEALKKLIDEMDSKLSTASLTLEKNRERTIYVEAQNDLLMELYSKTVAPVQA